VRYSPETRVCESCLSRPWCPYVLPFVLFLLLTEPGRHFSQVAPWLYVTKTFLTVFLLWSFRQIYLQDLSIPLSFRQLVEAIVCGAVVLALWILAEGYLFQLDQRFIFSPKGLGHAVSGQLFLVGVHLFGSALVVPLMEELFWRSFLMRWLIRADFRSVPLGTFSWFSFLATAILFGLEHNRIVAGVCAGIFYNLLLVHQKNLRGVVLAHGITNFGLGLYVITTGNWQFW